MLKRLMASIALAALLAMPASGQTGCEDWNTTRFFELATALQVQRCLDAGANINARAEDGDTPLHISSRHSIDTQVTETLIEAGANVNAVNSLGMTPLFGTIHNINPFVAILLIERGAQFDEPEGIMGLSAINAFIRYNPNPIIIEAMIDNGLNLSNTRSNGDILWRLSP